MDEYGILVNTLDPSISWKDVNWLKSITRLPVIIKGVLTKEDAELAVEHGVQGIIVSNHGGRQLDGCLASVITHHMLLLKYRWSCSWKQTHVCQGAAAMCKNTVSRMHLSKANVVVTLQLSSSAKWSNWSFNCWLAHVRSELSAALRLSRCGLPHITD